MDAPFFYHHRMLAYDFGPGHPLKPERLRRTVELLGRYGIKATDPGEGSVHDVLRVHAREFVDAVQRLSSESKSGPRVQASSYGFASPGDTPPFPGMFEASLSYVAGSVSAAQAVRNGAQVAFGMAGGLHHARGAEASGFCVFNDAAIACRVLRERFDRVAYVDIDVHHGDGVQWIFYDDPTVLTCSIHEDGRTLYPGTGFVEETGADFSSLNVPMEAHTTGDVWRWAFQEAVMPALERFGPGAIVLQLGTDAHVLDPLGHLRATAQDWLAAVTGVKALGLPIVALGGGGYNLMTVPRMWGAAVLALLDVEVPDDVPKDLAEQWGMHKFFDEQMPGPPHTGQEHAQRVVDWLQKNHHPNIGAGASLHPSPGPVP